MLNKQKGNMYGFITHTWNPISGRCSIDCDYCYMKPMYQRFPELGKPIHIREKLLKDNLGKDNNIFIGSTTDMWATNVPAYWICRVLAHCRNYPDNQYLFQSKNPSRFNIFAYPDNHDNFTFCTTVETDQNKEAYIRINEISKLKKHGYKTMITVEPIMEFSKHFADLLRDARPDQINIGADSGSNGLPEPNIDTLKSFINKLDGYPPKIFLKDNLKRLL